MFRIDFDGLEPAQVVKIIKETEDYLGRNQDKYDGNWRFEYERIVLERLSKTTDYELIKKLVGEVSPKFIAYVEDPSPELQLIAIENSYNGYAIEYIKNPCRAALLACIDRMKDYNFREDDVFFFDNMKDKITPALMYYMIVKNDAWSYIYEASKRGLVFPDRFWKRTIKFLLNKGRAHCFDVVPENMLGYIIDIDPNLIIHVNRKFITNDVVSRIYRDISHPIALMFCAHVAEDDEVQTYLRLRFETR
jgi:hypothetical protein